MKYRRIITLACVAVLSMTTHAQQLNSGYFTDDYLFRHDLNAAYDNEQNYVSLPVIGGMSIKTMGNFGYEDIIRKNPLYPDESNKKNTTFLNPYLDDQLEGFSKGGNRLGAEVDITLLSAGFKAFGGYNTVALKSRSQMYGRFPYELFAFSANIGNGDYDIGDININARSFMELSLGHSRKLNDKLRVGGKLKFLLGVADADVAMKNVKAHLVGDQWKVEADAQAHVSMKGFSYKSEEVKYDSQEGTYQRVNGAKVENSGLNGFGMALDLGAVYQLDDNWELSAAVNDLGFISWNNDCWAENQQKEFLFDGFHDTAVKKKGGSTIDEQKDRYGDQISAFYNLQDQGDQGSRTTGIGARINLGVAYTWPEHEKLKIGFLSSTRLMGVHSWTEGRLSGNYQVTPWLDGNVNLAANSYTASMGWMLNFHPKGVNFFVGMDHILGRMSKEMIPLSSNSSIALGLSVAW